MSAPAKRAEQGGTVALLPANDGKNAPAMSEDAALVAVIARAAADPTVDVDKMERLLAMRERIRTRAAEQAFADAMNKAQAAMRPISADSANGSTKSRYASYGALDKAMRPIYTENGFALSFNTADCPIMDQVRVTCRVTHVGGHAQDYQADIPCDGKGARGGDVMSKTHANGSAFSYGQRYLLKLIFNIAVGDDDDGNAAGGSVNNGQPGCIDAGQAQNINDLIKRNKADINKFCAHFKIEAVPDLPAKKYSMAVEMLNVFGINNAKKEAGK